MSQAMTLARRPVPGHGRWRKDAANRFAHLALRWHHGSRRELGGAARSGRRAVLEL